MATKVMKVGTIEIATGTKRRIESEYAAWFDEIEIETKTAEIFAEFESGRIGSFARYKVEGEVVACNWAPAFGGVAYGAGTDTRGQRRETVVAIRGYDLATLVAEQRGGITLEPGFTVERTGQIECLGKTYPTYTIRTEEAQ